MHFKLFGVFLLVCVVQSRQLYGRSSSESDESKSREKHCSKWEVFQQCGTSCPPTCDNPTPTFCTRDCVSGCFCKPGLLRNKHGDCVEPCDCPPVTTTTTTKRPTTTETTTKRPTTTETTKRPITTETTTTKRPTTETTTTKHPTTTEPTTTKRPTTETTTTKKPTTTETTTTTTTKKPTTTETTTTKRPTTTETTTTKKPTTTETPTPTPTTTPCDSHESCDGKNEVFLTCGTACPATCDNPNPRFCTEQCVRGCFCKPGFVRDDDNKCVRKSQCKEPTTTTTTTKRPTTTETTTTKKPTTTETPTPTPTTTPCDSHESCDGKNEVFLTCGTACPATCDNPNPRFCTKQCVRGCFCKPGFVRDDDNKCVHKSQCKRCPKGKEYLECGSACPPDCESIRCGEHKICTLQCVAGCFCKKGTVLNDKGECVKPQHCY